MLTLSLSLSHTTTHPLAHPHTHSPHVELWRRRVGKQLASVLVAEEFSLEHWRQHELHPSNPQDWHVDFLFVLDALNFSFWMPKGQRYAVKYREKEWTGYWSLVAAMLRAIDVRQTSLHFKRICSIAFRNQFQQAVAAVPLTLAFRMVSICAMQRCCASCLSRTSNTSSDLSMAR